MSDPQPLAGSGQPLRKPRPRDVIELDVEKLAYGGKGVARREGDGFVVFVEGAAPGERVKAEIFRRKKDYAEAKVVEVVTPSPVRVEARCPMFGRCGGCAWQHLPYAEQLAWKDRIVRESLERLGGEALRSRLPAGFWREPVAAPSPWFYRNKMDFGFGIDQDTGETIVGFHRKGSFRVVLDVENCFIHPEIHDHVLTVFREWARENNLRGYDSKSHQGYLRNLIVRRSEAEQKTLIVLLTKTAEPAPGGLEALAQRLEARGVALAGMIHGLNAGLADTAALDRELARVGEDFFHERLGEKTFRVSASSFFQTNTQGAAKLYDVVLDRANLSGGETVLDAFCGTGTIGLYLAGRAAKVYGVELVPEAIEDAKRNAALNGLADRCDFRAGDARDLIPELDAELRAQNGGKPGLDVVVIDPPRGGMHKKALESLLGLDSPRFVYVSCMFPQTYHVEAVATFEKKR
jgi:23S rRNA (uracil1939-C5)-methyltransferase